MSNASGMPLRQLGRTGEKVSAIGLGGWHLALPHVDEPLAIRIVQRAIDEGITFLDNSWDYNDGASETRMGRALRGGVTYLWAIQCCMAQRRGVCSSRAGRGNALRFEIVVRWQSWKAWASTDAST